MRNLLNPFRPPNTADDSDPAAEARGSRRHHKRRHRVRKRILLAGSVLAVGAVVGSGFVVQSNVAATDKSIAATEALASSTGRDSDQLGAYKTVLVERAKHRAKDTIAGANIVLADAKGKADTTTLSASVATLSNFEVLAPERIYILVSQTNDASAAVKVAAKKVDRLAAKKAAAQKVAAEKEAAQQAAAEREAAQKAAAEKVAAENAAAAEAEQVAAEQETSSNDSSSSRPSAPSDPSGAQAIARDMMASQYGWGDDQFGCLVSLWDRESGWNVNAYNASSGATGIPQALPGSKMASAGDDWETNPATQISWGLGYISGSYGTPCAAWDHSESAGWY